MTKLSRGRERKVLDLKPHRSQAQWLMSIVPAVRGQLRQEDCHELEISLGYRTRLCLKNLKGGRIFISKGGPTLLSIAILIGQPTSFK